MSADIGHETVPIPSGPRQSSQQRGETTQDEYKFSDNYSAAAHAPRMQARIRQSGNARSPRITVDYSAV